MFYPGKNIKSQLPLTLRSLDVDLWKSRYFSSFSDFWTLYISPLERLQHLKLDGILPPDQFDFTQLQIPVSLLTIELLMSGELHKSDIVFDQLPSSLIYFKIDYGTTTDHPPAVIDVANVQGKTLDELKSVFILIPEKRFTWIT
ncbi:unnamed protein product [Ambrosiozyma monospora]|uniref:Unnamed protein product n=1 Tax=Ambrosiozyma monospora TaxID=43982 RepID=A0ACB5TCM2_AMBMO|nr:unnamed protein product [Ambrosiozyma monospora]